MLLLSCTIFILGLVSFLDTVFNYGSMFRTAFSAMLILLSIWAFVRARSAGDLLTFEIKSKTIAMPENQTEQIDQPQPQKQKKPEPVA